MGYIKHNTIVVIIDPYHHDIQAIYNRCLDIADSLLTNPVRCPTNGYYSFCMVPDGSKENWEESQFGDDKRQKLKNYLWFLKNKCYVDFVEIEFGGNFLDAKIVEHGDQ